MNRRDVAKHIASERRLIVAGMRDNGMLLREIGDLLGITPQGVHRILKQGRPFYATWTAMVSRCTHASCPAYVHYGARGITVCDRWRTYSNFEADILSSLGEKPSPKHSIDRIDNSRGYEPGNVRWATWSQQHRNKRTSRTISALGKTQTLAAWAEETGLRKGIIFARLKNGWAPDQAVSEAVDTHRRRVVGRKPLPRQIRMFGRVDTVAGWARFIGTSHTTMWHRLENPSHPFGKCFKPRPCEAVCRVTTKEESP